MTIRVLLADDHAVMREGLRTLLSAYPEISVVGEVSNGREAVRKAEELAPDVLVADISMPELNGIEATRMIRSKSPATRVIILSMHSNTEHVFRAFESGASGYVLKEAAASEVVDAIRTAHSGRRYLSPGLEEVMRDHRLGSAGTSPLDSLSIREREVLQLVVEGMSSADIAGKIHLSRKSVETYRSRLMKKIGVGDVPALVKFAIQHGITPPD